jgi:rhodanese-related sulfurtransferase
MNEKTFFYEQVTLVAKAIASPKRLELLDFISQGEKTVDVLARQAGITMKLASAHLQDLKSARLVNVRRDGRFIYYSIADSDVVKVLVSLRLLAEKRLTSLQETLQSYTQSPESMSTLDRRALMEKVEAEEVIVIDVRPRDEFNSGHLPHARSVPLDELKKLLGKLPMNKEIIAYCRGSYCLLSRDAVNTLRRKGYRASRLSEGISEWIAGGVQLARGSESN